MKQIKMIEELAKSGEQHDVMDALKLLTLAYIDMCGISLGCRTVVFWAAEAWQKRLAWLDLPLSETARKNGLTDFMPYISSDYDPEIYDEYDIAGMDHEELLDCCKQIIKEKDFDEPTTEVLCWGLLKSISEAEEKFQEVETKAQDGTILKGHVVTQTCGSTFISMESPYHLYASKDELVRDAKELLVEAYYDCHRLRKMENEARELYPRYQEELEKCNDKYELPKLQVFRHVYKSIVSKSVICSIDELFHEWFGLEFYVPQYKREKQ